MMRSGFVLVFTVAVALTAASQSCSDIVIQDGEGKKYHYDISRFAVPQDQTQLFVQGTEMNQGWVGTFLFLFFFFFLSPSLFRFF